MLKERVIYLTNKIIMDSYTYDELLQETQDSSTNSTVSFIKSLFSGAYGFLFGIALTGVVISMLLSAGAFIFYSGDSQKMAEAKRKLFTTVIIIFALSSVLFVVGLCMKIGDSINL